MKGCVFITVVAVVFLTLSLATSPKTTGTERQSAPAITEVKIDDIGFSPGALKVACGTLVTWTNRDHIPHLVVSTKGLFKSKVLDTDERFSYRFFKAGTYPYFCSIHPNMTGKVVVR